MSPTKSDCKLYFTFKSVSCLRSTFIDRKVFLGDPEVVPSPLISFSLSVKISALEKYEILKETEHYGFEKDGVKLYD